MLEITFPRPSFHKKPPDLSSCSATVVTWWGSAGWTRGRAARPWPAWDENRRQVDTRGLEASSHRQHLTNTHPALSLRWRIGFQIKKTKNSVNKSDEYLRRKALTTLFIELHSRVSVSNRSWSVLCRNTKQIISSKLSWTFWRYFDCFIAGCKHWTNRKAGKGKQCDVALMM